MQMIGVLILIISILLQFVAAVLAVRLISITGKRLEELVRERTAELETKNVELEKFNKFFVGRKLRMIELKKIIAEQEKIISELEKEIVDLRRSRHLTFS